MKSVRLVKGGKMGTDTVYASFWFQRKNDDVKVTLSVSLEVLNPDMSVRRLTEIIEHVQQGPNLDGVGVDR